MLDLDGLSETTQPSPSLHRPGKGADKSRHNSKEYQSHEGKTSLLTLNTGFPWCAEVPLLGRTAFVSPERGYPALLLGLVVSIQPCSGSRMTTCTKRECTGPEWDGFGRPGCRMGDVRSPRIWRGGRRSGEDWMGAADSVRQSRRDLPQRSRMQAEQLGADSPGRVGRCISIRRSQMIWAPVFGFKTPFAHPCNRYESSIFPKEDLMKNKRYGTMPCTQETQ